MNQPPLARTSFSRRRTSWALFQQAQNNEDNISHERDLTNRENSCLGKSAGPRSSAGSWRGLWRD